MSSIPPTKADVGSAVNDLVRELGGAFGISVLGSFTLSRYQSRLTPSLADHPNLVIARNDLAQAFTVDGGSRSPFGAAAARFAYSSGLDLAMVVGSAFVLAAAIDVWFAMPPASRPSAVPAATNLQSVKE